MKLSTNYQHNSVDNLRVINRYLGILSVFCLNIKHEKGKSVKKILDQFYISA